MRNLVCGTAAILIAMSAPAVAQDGGDPSQATSQPTPTLAIGPLQSSADPVLQAGTEVPLILLEELTTKNKRLQVLERFRLETAEPVMVNGVTVIPVGTPAIGEITEVRNKGMWGKSGRFVARLLYLTVNGRRIRLAGEFDDKGKAGGAGAIATSALVFLPAGFFMTGTSAHLPPGTEVKGFIDENVPLVAQGEAAPEPAPAATPAGLTIPPPPDRTPPVAEAPRPEPGNSRVSCLTCR